MTLTVFLVGGYTSLLLMATSVVMEFSKKLRVLMGKNRVSQDMLARALDVSQGTVSNWTRDQGMPNLYEAARIAEFFHVDLKYLADDALDEPPPEEMTAEERALVSVFRAKELSFEEAVRLLERRPVESFDPTSPWVGPQRDLRGRTQRLDAERREPKRVEAEGTGGSSIGEPRDPKTGKPLNDKRRRKGGA